MGMPTWFKKKLGSYAKKRVAKAGSSSGWKKKTKLRKKLAQHPKEKFEMVMKEFHKGQLKTSYGTKVTNPKQAFAIAMSEAKRHFDKQYKRSKKVGGKKLEALEASTKAMLFDCAGETLKAIDKYVEMKKCAKDCDKKVKHVFRNNNRFVFKFTTIEAAKKFIERCEEDGCCSEITLYEDEWPEGKESYNVTCITLDNPIVERKEHMLQANSHPKRSQAEPMQFTEVPGFSKKTEIGRAKRKLVAADMKRARKRMKRAGKHYPGVRGDYLGEKLSHKYVWKAGKKHPKGEHPFDP